MRARIISVQIIVFFLLLGIAGAEITLPNFPPGSGACCIPRFSGEIIVDGLEGLSEEEGIAACNNEGSEYVAQCYSNGQLIDSNFAASGCCCNTLTNRPYISQSGGNQFVSKLYCDALSQQDGNIQYATPGNCQEICQINTDFYDVTGRVFDQNFQPLDDIIITSSDGVTTDSNSDGTFDFDTYRFSEGIYTFSFSNPQNYPLSCDTQTESRNVNANTYIEIILTCEVEDVQTNCEPIPQVLINGEFQTISSFDEDIGWSDCQPIGDEFLRVREVQDLAQCDGSPEGIQYTSLGCENEVISSSCDGNYDVGELCDGGRFLIPGTDDTTATLTCSRIFGEGYTGDVTCNGCQQDYSACLPPCDCQTQDQCSSGACAEQCATAPLCVGCEDALSFIPLGAPSGDLFELYTHMETADDRFPSFPIEYTQGSKDVTLRWNYDQRSECTASLTGFDVEVCYQDGNSRSCDTSKVVHSESLTSRQAIEYTFVDVLEADTSFCYNVIARLGDGQRQAAFEDDALFCFDTGSEQCMVPNSQGRNCALSDGVYSPSFCNLYSSTSKTNLELTYATCGVGETCIETAYVPGTLEGPNSGATCMAQQVCDSCNGLFGLFASYNLPAFSEDGRQNFQCQDLLFQTIPGATPPGSDTTAGFGQCYVEESQSLFSFYEECEEVTSCYDYKSRGTCGTDPCFKFSENAIGADGNIIDDPVINCLWQDYNEEVGLGACQPAQEELQDCSLCDEDSPLGFCTKDVCGLYGNCFYKESLNEVYQEDAFAFQEREDLVPACLHVSDMSCALYDTIDECQGLDPSLRVEPDIDLLYYGVGLEEDQRILAQTQLGNTLIPTSRIAGTNTITAQSNDLFGFGACTWYENRCLKNSNGFVGTIVEDDCDEDPTVPCYKDNESPRTTPSLKDPITDASLDLIDTLLYGAGELFDITFVVEDDTSTPETITTYVSFLSPSCIQRGLVPCLGGETNNCVGTQNSTDEIETAYAVGCYIYPQETLEDIQTRYVADELSFETGEYMMLYFSEDDARNLEELKSVELYVDSLEPQVFISEVASIPLNPYEDIFVSDVIISVDIFEPSSCELQLFNQQNPDEPVIPGIISFEVTNARSDAPYNNVITYPQLIDGTYEVTITCIDDFKNRGSDNRSFDVQADASINVSRPIAQVFTSMDQVLLEIRTQQPGQCKYEQTPSGLAETYESSRFEFTSQGLDSTGQFLHTATVDPELGTASGIYIIQTSCVFADGTTTQGKRGDVLSFAIDGLAPEGNVLENSEQFAPRDSPWKNTRDLEIVCDDQRSNTEATWAYTDCAILHYCINSQGNFDEFRSADPRTVCEQNDGEYDLAEASGPGDAVSISLPLRNTLEYEYKYLHYYFEDFGGWRSDVVSTSLKIRDTETSDPLVVIE